MGLTRCALQLTAISIALLAVMVSEAVSQPSFPAAPPAGRFISDAAGVIGREEASEIDRMAAALFVEKGLPVRVVTIRSLAAQGAGGYTIERYAAQLVQSWQDEQARSYGMLLLVAAEDRRARIQLGSAWGTAHDTRARRVMDRLILPAFRKGELSAGILGGVRGFDAMGRQLALPAVGQPSWVPLGLTVEALDAPWWLPSALVAGGLVVAVGIVSLARRGSQSWAWAAAAFVFALLLARFFSSAEASDSEGGAADTRDAEGGATGAW